MLSDKQKANYLKTLKYLDAFEAELQLEDELFSSLVAQLLTLRTEEPSLALKYAEVRGKIDILKELKAKREYLISTAVEK